MKEESKSVGEPARTRLKSSNPRIRDNSKKKKKGKKRLVCSKCDEKHDEEKMEAHLKDHDTKLAYPCESCDKTFVSVWAWHRHGFRHHEKELECDECNKKYQDVDRFTWHLRYTHAEKSYSCSKCAYSTTMRAKLRRHVEQTHTKQYAVHCDVCSKGFLDRSDLEEHKNLHSGNAPNQCELCGKSFRLKTTLRAHKFKFHAELYPNACRLCNRGFATKSGLESHFLAHAENRRFICDFCGKHLTTAATLREHRRMHTGEHPFRCDVCGKAFRAKKHLFRHVATHFDSRSEKRNHECHYCNKTFSNQASCLSHTQKCH